MRVECVILLVILAALSTGCTDNTSDSNQVRDIQFSGYEWTSDSTLVLNTKGSGTDLICHEEFALGNRFHRVVKRENQNAVELNDTQMQIAGRHQFVLFSAGTAVDTLNLFTQVGENVTPMELQSGPKSIFTTTAQPHMFVALPKDSLNNPLDDGKLARFNLVRPSKNTELHFDKTNHMIGYYQFYAGRKAGKTLAGTAQEKGLARLQTVVEKAGWPTSIKLTSENSHLYADSREETLLVATLGPDKYGNAIPDGTLVYFEVQHDDGTSGYYAKSVNQKGEIALRNPSIPGKLKIRAYVDQGSESNELALRYKSAIRDFSLDLLTEESLLEVGPVLSEIGGFAPDGTIVKLIIVGSTTQIINARLKNGYCRFDLQSLPKIADTGSVKVEVGGIEKELEMKLDKGNN